MKEEQYIKLDDDSGNRVVYNAACEREEYNKDVKTRTYGKLVMERKVVLHVWWDNVKH